MVQMFLFAFKRMERDWFMVDHFFYFLSVATSSLHFALFLLEVSARFRKKGVNVASAPRL